VLDRPDPVTGSFVQGPVSDVGKENFTDYWTVPVRPGMTMGELAKMFNAERSINASSPSCRWWDGSAETGSIPRGWCG